MKAIFNVRWFRAHIFNLTLIAGAASFAAWVLVGCVAAGGRNARPTLADGRAAMPLLTGWEMQFATNVPDDTGEKISTVGYQPSKWYKATVPGTVLTTLVNNGVYPEPLYGENNRPDKIPESLCKTTYWYRRVVKVPASYAGKKVWLNFDGINFTANIWVNGHNIGDVRGAFARGIFEISQYVKAGEDAAVAVHINPMAMPGHHAEKSVATGLGRNGGDWARGQPETRIDLPSFIGSTGWDWVPPIRDRNIGIWQQVTLSASGPVVMLDPQIITDLPLPRTDTADVSVNATLKNLTDAPQKGVLRGEFGGVKFEMPVTVPAGGTNVVSVTPKEAPQMHVSNPKLWWPNGFGEPNLYNMHLSFDIEGAASDERDITFGIRKITYMVPDSPYMTISVNGVKVFCKGGDWALDEGMKRNPRERLDAEVRFQKEANYTMIRNWVGHSTSEDFYDLCDHYGIMVWDEFFQSGPSDSKDPQDPELYLANVKEKVLRYRNHACIALWCGRNEGDPSPPVVAQGLLKMVPELDPTRVYHPNSDAGAGVRSGGPYGWRAPQLFYVYATTGRMAEVFKTEIGCKAIPTLESIQGMMPTNDAETFPNEDWAEHDWTGGRGGGPDQYLRAIDARYGNRFGKFDLRDMVRKSQLANYEAYRAMYEGRFAQLFTGSTAVLTWMSNPSQPTTKMQLYSYDLEPFSAFFGTRKACEPLHIMMHQTNFHVMVINHTTNAFAGGKARVRVVNLDGTQKLDYTKDVTAAACAPMDLGAIPFPEGLSPVHFVEVDLFDAKGERVSDNVYWRGLSENDLTAMDAMPVAALKANITRHDAGGKCLLEVTLSNPTKVVAVMAHLQLRREHSNERVLPVFYTDNYLTLLPGESRTVSVEAASKDLRGENPMVMLDGWNVTTQTRTSGGVGFAENTAARVASVGGRGGGARGGN